METQLVREQPADQVYTSTRARTVALLGPLTVVGGIIWAIVQPSRLTLLHPYHQGFWWLVIEAPLLVVFAGIAFAVFVARPLVAELEGDDGAA